DARGHRDSGGGRELSAASVESQALDFFNPRAFAVGKTPQIQGFAPSARAARILAQGPMAGRVDRSLILAVAGGLVVLAAALGGSWFVLHRDAGPKTPPPASMGGLVVQTGQSSASSLDPNHPLR